VYGRRLLEHQWGAGNVPGLLLAVGTHYGGDATVGWRKEAGAVAFVGRGRRVVVVNGPVVFLQFCKSGREMRHDRIEGWWTECGAH
jgi:hypothetical protein